MTDVTESVHWMQRSVLITGGFGFIGSNLARTLVDLGANVTVIDCMEPGTGANRHNLVGFEDKLQFCFLDLNDTKSLAEVVDGQEVIFHLAARESHIDSMKNPLADLDCNNRAMLSLLEVSRNQVPEARFVFTSTRQIYGKPLSLPVSEEHPLSPVDVNGIHKRCAEDYLMLYQRNYRLKPVILRLTNTFGPRMYIRDGRQTFLGLFIRQAIENKQISVFGTGAQMRDIAYIDDVVEALLRSAVSEQAIGEVFNVGGYDRLSLVEIAESICSLSKAKEGYRLIPFPADRASIDIGSCYSDDTKIRELLGWRPITPFCEGIQKSLAFFKEHWEYYK